VIRCVSLPVANHGDALERAALDYVSRRAPPGR
jgi:hypothetical protein